MNNKYGGIIWTNHALERLRERGIRQSDALATFNRPEQSRQGSNERGSWVYYRTYGNERIEVVAKKNEQGEWIILSVWSKPVYGNQDQSKRTNQGLFMRFITWLFR
jgi:hypothetical protein